jgi:predicted RNA-binding protein Jag
MSTIVKEFEGRNEKEAIDRAIEELGLDRSEIDFEIVESKKPGILFRGGKVKIRVHVSEEEVEAAVQDGRLSSERPLEMAGAPRRQSADQQGQRRRRGGGGGGGGDRQPALREPAPRGLEPNGEIPEEEIDQDAAEAALEAAVLRGETISRLPRAAAQGEPLPHEAEIVEFVKTLLGLMGFKAQVVVGSREPNRLGIDVETDRSAVLIGKQGKTLEAFQFICNLAASRLGAEGTRVIIDTQDYRSRRERSLERMAAQAAERVRRSRQSVLLEPLNPFERRIVHTAIARRGDVETESEGDGLYKRIRVSWKGGGNGGGRREGGNSSRRSGSRGRDRGYDRDRDVGPDDGRDQDYRRDPDDRDGGSDDDRGRGDDQDRFKGPNPNEGRDDGPDRDGGPDPDEGRD